MTASIPASYLDAVTPSVISPGGSALALIGLALTNSSRVPMGAVKLFPLQSSVADYFGASSVEAQAAKIYFKGFDNSNVKPAGILFAQFNQTAVAAWLRGGSLKAMTLTSLKALAGVLSVTVDGVLHTSSAIDLSAATSFSNAATLIQAAFTTPGFTVAFDSIASAFVITSGTTGAASTISVGSGTIAAGLALTTQTGAVTSQGADAATPGPFMDSVVAATQNWVTLFLTFDPDGGAGNAQKLQFAEWVDGKTNGYLFAGWDDDLTPTESTNAATSMAAILVANNTSGTAPIYAPSWDKAAFLAGAIASIDFNQKDGRTNMAARVQSGLSADVTDATTAANLKANGYNFYGAFASRTGTFTEFQDGRVTGDFLWIDTYVNQIWMNDNFQADLIALRRSVKSIPYNLAGRTLIRQALQDTVDKALNFGAIRPGVVLSESEAAQVNAAAGIAIDSVLTTQGYYIQVLDASPDQRKLRGTPPCTVWYMDGGSVNRIDLASVAVL